ncbi:cytochrome P450 [Rhodococcoides trifolii]|uniref:Cytochrome P450 n=1 Tax=Rhodococcoides trifolii TaxID=908250 RepID=A0A917CM86_9NOCA|nr:cytochrome P450 [Rhodococcus trifolii]GGF90843.1 cytochrome P450 [Rhodococcus trifolii]
MTSEADRLEIIDSSFFDDPYAFYDRWHGKGPVHHVRLVNGREAYVVTGYAEGRAALADPRLHKASDRAAELLQRRKSSVQYTVGEGLSSSMLNSDPPDHTRLRSLVNKAFTARSIASMRPRIETITTELLDAMDQGDTADLIEDFAVPLPITVICELLGVPFEDRADFRSWTDTLLTVAVATDQGRAARSMSDYLRGLIQSKRTTPTDDMLTMLVDARDEGDRLSETELVSTAFLLLVAGHETTVNLIGNGACALLHNPDQLALLRDDPSLIPGAVEEFLRYDGPIDFATLRYTREPVVIGGTEIPADEFVYVALLSANRDGEKYPNPEVLDVTRATGGHVAFGYGIHYCVGAPLARMEAQIAFTQLLQRFPHLHLAPAEQRYRESYLIHGLTHLPVRLR